MPCHDEYVKLGDATPLLAAFDRWVAENMQTAIVRGPAFSARYAVCPAHVFGFRSPDATALLAGAIAPSVDRAGRVYPFVVAREVPIEAAIEVAGSWELLPLALEELWDAAGRLVVSAATLPSVAALRASIEAAPAPGVIDAPASGFDEWARGMRLDELSELLHGEELSTALRDAVSAVVSACAPHRGVNPPRTRLSLRLPLGRAGGAAVCFWLAVAQRALGGERVPPTFFWTHDGESGQMLMCPGVAPRTTLDQLFARTESDEVLDLQGPRAEAGANVHAGVASVFRSGEGTVRDLLLAEI